MLGQFFRICKSTQALNDLKSAYLVYSLKQLGASKSEFGADSFELISLNLLKEITERPIFRGHFWLINITVIHNINKLRKETT